MIAKVAFIYPCGAEGCWEETIISHLTGGLYGHVEIHWFEGNAIYRGTATSNYGVVFTPNDQFGNPIVPDSKEYFYVDLPDDFPNEQVIAWLQTEVGSGYDYAGVLRFVLPFLQPSKTKWFCSEIVAKMLSFYQPYEVLATRPYLYSPNGLYVKLLQLQGAKG